MENQIQFPASCFFGKLRPNSVCETEDQITALYHFFGTKIHSLTYLKDENYWWIKDISPKGEEIRSSGGISLQYALFYHSMSIDDKSDPILKRIRRKLKKLGNVWFDPINSAIETGCTSLDHAGESLFVRLLIKETDPPANEPFIVSLIAGRILAKFHGFELDFVSEYKTWCVFREESGYEYCAEANIAEFLVPSAYICDAIEIMYDLDMLDRDDFDRIFIHDSVGRRDSKEYCFALTDIPDAVQYSVILKGTHTPDEEYETLMADIKSQYDIASF